MSPCQTNSAFPETAPTLLHPVPPCIRVPHAPAKSLALVKTLDTTTAAKVANPSQVYSSLKSNIDAVANFEEASLLQQTVSASRINARHLDVAVPAGTTPAQWVEINRAIQYGQSRGVTVKITEVK